MFMRLTGLSNQDSPSFDLGVAATLLEITTKYEVTNIEMV